MSVGHPSGKNLAFPKQVNHFCEKISFPKIYLAIISLEPTDSQIYLNTM